MSWVGPFRLLQERLGSIKDLDSIDQGRQFVEQFEPWRDFFPGEPLELEPGVVTPE